LFDTYIMVDWSAANVPRLGRDSIWICRLGKIGETLVNPATRYAAKGLIGDWLAAAQTEDQRVLLGFDFPFGYPVGFAARLGLPGTPWRAVWDEIAGLVQDDERNRNNRFDVAESLNHRISGSGFPFWGCPAAPLRAHLQGKHHRRHGSDGLAERRLVDLYIPSAQPCWKLLGAGSVGGQALTGIPVARALRDDPRWRRDARVWPFETGVRAPREARIVMAEVYPSLWAVKPEADEAKDAAQVRTVARFLRARDQADELPALFAGDSALTPAQRNQVEREEAWTLGVTAAGQRPIPLAADVASEPFSPCATAIVSPLRPRRRRGANTGAGEERRRRENKGPSHTYTYLRDAAAISRKSLAVVRAEANLARFPRALRRVAARTAHAAGDAAILDDLAWSAEAVAAGRAALAAGAPILVDSTMVMAGIIRERLPSANEILCFLRDPAVAELAAAQGTTRSAAAVELWRPHLAGAVVAIGNAPTALFRLLEILDEGAPEPAVILGFPVGFVGAAEAKSALAAFGVEFITLHGRRGGSAIAAAALNALSSAR
jgi:precorrin-8X/cobalt-precorrin-8 methylmutase